MINPIAFGLLAAALLLISYFLRKATLRIQILESAAVAQELNSVKMLHMFAAAVGARVINEADGFRVVGLPGEGDAITSVSDSNDDDDEDDE